MDPTAPPGTALPWPTVPFASCPIQASLGVLGRKWALLVLRDVAWFPGRRFSDLLRANAGLTPRVLTFRLKELTEGGFLERVPGADRREVGYRLTPKGRDVVPILAALIQFGIRHHAPRVFADGKPRAMDEAFTGADAALLLRGPAPAGGRPGWAGGDG